MRRHSIIARLGPTDDTAVDFDPGTVETKIHLIDGKCRLSYGLGQITDELRARGIHPSDTGLDLAILAATVTAADTRISRNTDSQDSWTREIDLYVPVQDPELWVARAELIQRTLEFLTGDLWRIFFRARHSDYEKLLDEPGLAVSPFSSVSLFSGGLDSFIGAIDLLAAGENPLFVSHYWDASTGSQKLCASRIAAVYGEMEPRHVRAHVGFRDDLVEGSTAEKTTRGRSFLFLALAALAASGLKSPTICVPENGFISLNVPLDPLRLGAWSTRTTHPFYLARWQEMLDGLGISAMVANPYRFSTKGEMIAGCADVALVKKYGAETISCSSVTKARWKGLPPAHCGYCVPCLIRRAAFHAAFKKDKTTYTLADLSTQSLNGRSAEAEHVRSFQLMARRLTQEPAIEDILVHKPGPLTDYPAKDVASYASVFRRGIEEVATVVNDVVVTT